MVKYPLWIQKLLYYTIQHEGGRVCNSRLAEIFCFPTVRATQRPSFCIFDGEATVKIFSSLNQIKSTSLSEKRSSSWPAGRCKWAAWLAAAAVMQFMRSSRLKTFQRQIIVSYVRDSSRGVYSI